MRTVFRGFYQTAFCNSVTAETGPEKLQRRAKMTHSINDCLIWSA